MNPLGSAELSPSSNVVSSMLPPSISPNCSIPRLKPPAMPGSRCFPNQPASPALISSLPPYPHPRPRRPQPHPLHRSLSSPPVAMVESCQLLKERDRGGSSGWEVAVVTDEAEEPPDLPDMAVAMPCNATN